VLLPGGMSILKYISITLFALVTAGGCVAEELPPEPTIYNGGFGPALERTPPLPVNPHEPREPSDPPDIGVCGSVVTDLRGEVVSGDYTVEGKADLDLLRNSVVVTGVLIVTSGRPLDLAALDGIRCVVGDLQLPGTDSFAGLINLEYIGGVVLVDDAR